MTRDEEGNRNIIEVILLIVKEVPTDWSGYSKFKERLDWIASDASYRPPETQVVSWDYLVNALYEYLDHEEGEQWVINISNIIRDI